MHAVQVAAIRDLRIHNYIEMISVVILWWDHIISFPLEVTSIWKRPKTLISWIYLVNRYLASISRIAFFVINWEKLSNSACKTTSLLNQILLFFNQAMICLLLLIRVYAIYARDRRILYLFATMCTVMLTATILSLVKQRSSMQTRLSGCKLAHTESNAIRLAVPWECMLVYDAVVLLLTIIKTYSLAATRAKVSLATNGVHIPTIVLRDGILYFVGITVSNAINIMFFYYPPPLLKGALSTLNSVINITLVSRMVLNLRDSATQSEVETQVTAQSWGNLNFASRGTFRDMQLETVLDISRAALATKRHPASDNWSDIIESDSTRIIGPSYTRRTSPPSGPQQPSHSREPSWPREPSGPQH